MSADSPFDPENRELYTALVRAPDGYSFGHAIATTYSLDFETALAIPISIVFRDAENRDEMMRSPLALLQSVERMADGRTVVGTARGGDAETERLVDAAGKIHEFPRSAIRERTSVEKPFITPSTMIAAATPTDTPPTASPWTALSSS